MPQRRPVASQSGAVAIETRGGVRWLRLNRPDRLNAYDSDMLDELIEAVRDSNQAQAVVITGTGRAFCSGGFLGNLAHPDPNSLRRMFYGSVRLFDEIRNCPVPVIAAVNGYAIGGGNELVVACDLAIAAESAVFGQSGPRIGSAPVLGGTNMLTIVVGEKRAKEVSFLCRRYKAREALAMGWINAVVPKAELEREVERWCSELLKNSRRYLEIAKISSNVWWNACRDSYLSGLGMLTQAIGSEDMVEGAQAFIEKRQPDFPSRRQ